MKLSTFYFLFFICFALQLNAQVGVNTSAPNDSSILDIVSNDKGLLIPRVELLSTTDVITILNPSNSLLVFNKVAVNDVVVGYYYWSTPLNRWIKFLDELDKPGSLFATFPSTKTTILTAASSGNTIFNYSNIQFNSIVGASITGTSLTLPPGDYIIESSVYIGRDNLEYILRVNGTPKGLKATMATVKTQAEIVPQGQIAVFTLTTISTIDFVPLSTNGGASLPINPSLSYLKITKL